MEMICIGCPLGCKLTVNRGEDGAISVSGNRCKKGERFAVDELTAPVRTVCSTVKTVFPEAPVLPVRTSKEIPKDRIFDVMAEINKTVVETRPRRGDAVIPNVLGLGADIIATSDMLSK